jgi:nucleotide-binding universal stress UspA family protein
MKKIIVPCDLSEPSKEAIKLAVDIASRTNGSVTILYALYISVTNDPILIGDGNLTYNSTYYDQLKDRIEKQLTKIIKTYSKHQVKINLDVTYGEVISALKDAIEKKKADLIIMGTHGASGAKEFLIGSTAEKVVRNISVPVLVVRKASAGKKFRNILLPSTLPFNQSAFVKKVKEVQQLFGSTIHILLVNTPAHFVTDKVAFERLYQFAKHYKLENYKLHFRSSENEEKGIIDFATDEGIDLIAMGTHGRKGLAHLFFGSLTEDLVNHYNIPILSYRLR